MARCYPALPVHCPSVQHGPPTPAPPLNAAPRLGEVARHSHGAESLVTRAAAVLACPPWRRLPPWSPTLLGFLLRLCVASAAGHVLVSESSCPLWNRRPVGPAACVALAGDGRPVLVPRGRLPRPLRTPSSARPSLDLGPSGLAVPRVPALDRASWTRAAEGARASHVHTAADSSASQSGLEHPLCACPRRPGAEPCDVGSFIHNRRRVGTEEPRSTFWHTSSRGLVSDCPPPRAALCACARAPGRPGRAGAGAGVEWRVPSATRAPGSESSVWSARAASRVRFLSVTCRRDAVRMLNFISPASLSRAARLPSEVAGLARVLDAAAETTGCGVRT